MVGDLPYSHNFFSSRHPNGANFVFGDGSVNFINEEIDFATWQNLNYIHDGNTITEF